MCSQIYIVNLNIYNLFTLYQKIENKKLCTWSGEKNYYMTKMIFISYLICQPLEGVILIFKSPKVSLLKSTQFRLFSEQQMSPFVV